ncbi:hypothetical protein ACE38V_18545 [Cytobacillus sp. Hz8]|uniref:hypothetical protein n=1 Tax=Cytobacillus sp. Hz8 TaxID=3347168 RepID=UPI0035D6952A
MYQVALVFFACILAGFGLIKIPAVWIFAGSFLVFLKVVGVIVIIIFSLALLYLGFKALFSQGL